jgi:hypothetical protein
MKKRKKKIIIGIAFLVFVLWVYLFASSQAILTHSQGPFKEQDENSKILQCTYLTGLGFITQEYWYAPNGVMGKAACPRIIKL